MNTALICFVSTYVGNAKKEVVSLFAKVYFTKEVPRKRDNCGTIYFCTDLLSYRIVTSAASAGLLS